MTDRGRKVFNILLALILAVAAWVYVIYNYKPTTDMTYNNVPISFTGEEALAERGLGIAKTSTDHTDVVLNQNRVNTADISEEDISIIADVSGAVEGENKISLMITGPEGTRVSESEYRTITVNVERVDSVEMEISVEFEGAPAEADAIPMVTEISSTTATVVGAASDIEKVDKIVAYVEPSDLSENERNFTRTLYAVDKDGKKLQHMVIYPEEVRFTAATGHLKNVKIISKITDSSEDNYERTYSMPESITVMGSAQAVSSLESVSAEDVEIGYIYEDAEIKLVLDLPEGVVLYSSPDELVLKVTVTEKTEEEQAEPAP